MAKPYVPRLATARTLMSQLDALGRLLGLHLKATRDYTVAGGKLTQSEIAAAARVPQGYVSNLETYKSVPNQKTLRNMLKAYEFQADEKAFVQDLLDLLRDHGGTIEKLDKIR